MQADLEVSGSGPASAEHQQVGRSYLAATWNALELWASLVVKLLTAVVGVVLLAAAVVLFPVWSLIPPWFTKLAFQLVFKLGYSIHVFTPLGRLLHLRMVQSRRDNRVGSHTVQIKASHLTTCEVIPVPILNDNYGYILIDKRTNQAAVVDPADPELIIQMLEARKVTLAMVLTTHRHHDHAGGNLALQKFYPDCVLVAGAKDNCAGTTKPVGDSDRLSFGETHISVIETPCHTGGHVVYLIHSRPPPLEGDLYAYGHEIEAALTGDCLFIGGVGAFFHGGEADMHQCIKNLAWVGDQCLVFCGHEYTVENTRFASWLEPDNGHVVARKNWAVKRRAFRESTVGSVTLGDERQLNPFMRVSNPAFSRMTSRRAASLQLETKGTEWPLKGLFARKSKGELYLHDHEAGSHGNHVELDDVGSTASLPLLPDKEAIKVMKRLNLLMGLWGAKHSQQLPPPCCVHGTCARRLTCSGHVKGLALRNAMVQTMTDGHHRPSVENDIGSRL